MLIYELDGFKVEIFLDQAYTLNSADNIVNYKHIYISDNYKDYGTKIGVKLIDNDSIISSAVLIAGFTDNGISKDIVVIDDNKILIVVGNILFCLDIDTLTLKWKVEVDQIYCMQLYKFDDFYITHGEMFIKRINKQGMVDWEFCGSDIFVTLSGNHALIFECDKIKLKDYEGNKYCLDFEGNLISS